MSKQWEARRKAARAARTKPAEPPADKRSGLDKPRDSERSPEARLYKTAAWLGRTRWVVERDRGICYLCQHPGATSADHVLSRTERPDIDFYDARNLKATHFHPCPVCGLRCQLIKAGGSEARARRLIAEKLGRDPRDETPKQEGRDCW